MARPAPASKAANDVVLTPEDIQNGEDQHNVEQHRDDGGQVVGQGQVHLAAPLQPRPEQPQSHTDQPAADDPGSQSTQQFQAEISPLGRQKIPDDFCIHTQSPSDGGQANTFWLAPIHRLLTDNIRPSGRLELE